MSLPVGDLSWMDKTRYEALLNSGEAYFLWTHIYGIQPRGIAPQLANGLGWHDAMDHFWRLVKWEGADPASVIPSSVAIWAKRWAETPSAECLHSDGSPPSLREETPTYNSRRIEKALGVYAENFNERFADYDLLDIETSYRVDLPFVSLRGRWDKPLRHRESGLVVIGEHKTTTSEDKTTKGFPTAWYHKWWHDAGTKFYALAGRRAFGADYGGVLVDGTLTTANPATLLVGPVEFSDSSIDRFERDMKIRLDRLRAGEYPCNPNACAQWGRNCTCADLCEGGYEFGDDVPLPAGMEIRPWHPERG